MSRQKKPIVTKTLGHGLAHVQHVIDSLSKKGFKILKDVGNNKSQGTSKNAYVKNGKKVGKKVLKFMGEVGDEYYKKYEELKKK